eukprot:TRINITY_DN7869_c0_g1_i1.p1 TRINITY_DN7869_c0_g1~~TRINITY_DN7869_c0_g1_i1.p1  ORF type:complete len:106 (-),score=35.18 TRINITY_DN7869_c0_g1_i1:13-330(-)
MSGKLGLKLGAVPKREAPVEANEGDAASGQDIKVFFHLPSGTVLEFEAKMGLTVEQLKAFLEQKEGLAFDTLVLTYKDKPMLDPLTLSDVPVDPSQDCHVTVSKK